MEIKKDKIVFDVWIDFESFHKEGFSLNEIILDSIGLRERLHSLKLDRSDFNFVTTPIQLEKKYQIKVFCKII